MNGPSYPTPDYGNVLQYDDVYEPREDSFLLLDALEQDSKLLKDLRPSLCVEVGSGSGVVISFLVSILGKYVHYIATDINPKACLCTSETAKRNGAKISVINTNLVDGCNFFSKYQVDILLFNPPYVVTSSDEVSSSGISAAWAGGRHGREVMDRLFPLVPFMMSDKGIFYLLVSEENRPDEINDVMANHDFSTETVLTRKAKNEKLRVLRIRRLGKNNGGK